MRPTLKALSLGGAVLFLPLAVAAAACYKVLDSNYQCCTSYTIPCSAAGASWNCIVTFTGSAFISIVGPAGLGESGQLNFVSIPDAGACTMNAVACGPRPGQCIPGAQIPVECMSTLLDGSSCKVHS